MKYPPIIVIAGPTATGKTGIATKLAKEFSGYIINADSRQVYKELQIGTAQPSKEDIEKAGVKHYLFGHKSIKEQYSLYEYQKDVMHILKKNKDNPAFLVGGTGLYIDSVVHNYKLEKIVFERSKLENLNLEELQDIVGDRLEELNESDRENPRRLIRFIEKGYKHFEKGKELNHLYLIYYNNLTEVEKNIKERIDRMFSEGLIEENINLKENEFAETIGYREFEEYFKNNISIEELKEKIYINTRKYAKRQLTWFKRNKDALWVTNYEEAYTKCKEYLASM
jgi:tRNA dimethylallyltransferase